MDPIVFERGDHLYVVASVAPFEPQAEEIADLAFAGELRQQAPNPHFVWMRGQYVEADTPNLNRHMWTAGELAIKSLTPRFCPVTVMHDPRTAVGVIADTKLLTPEADNVPRSKIETTLALWGHRFPEAVEEAMHNWREGTLMQSMEALVPDYSCSECGMTYHKMPGGFERDNWCQHLRDMETSNASRILRNVTFTGTGLIFGTRGSKGADPHAYLEAFQAEVAEAHHRWHDADPSRSNLSMATISIEQAEYDRIKSERDSAIDRAEQADAATRDAEAAAEAAEAAKAKAETERDAEIAKREAAEESARAIALRDERLAKLGEGFKAKLGDKTKARLTEQAAKLTDEEWAARLEELAEAYGIAADAEGSEESSEDTFSDEEVAGAGFTVSRENASEPTAMERRSVMGGLFGSK